MYDNANQEVEKMYAQQKLAVSISLKHDLEMQLQRAKSEVDRLTELIHLLGEHPEVNRILELLGHRCVNY